MFFMVKLLKPEVNQAHATIPYDISLFYEPIQSIFPLMSQILGLDIDQLVTEVMVETFYLVSQSKEKHFFKYDEFLDEKSPLN